jgi:hypothetical protein
MVFPDRRRTFAAIAHQRSDRLARKGARCQCRITVRSLPPRLGICPQRGDRAAIELAEARRLSLDGRYCRPPHTTGRRRSAPSTKPRISRACAKPACRRNNRVSGLLLPGSRADEGHSIEDQCEWAAKNPRATFKAPITVEDVPNSRMIASASVGDLLARIRPEHCTKMAISRP